MPPELQPILVAVLSVVALILLVTRLRVHPFLGLGDRHLLCLWHLGRCDRSDNFWSDYWFRIATRIVLGILLCRSGDGYRCDC
jgi:hypothetical protein